MASGDRNPYEETLLLYDPPTELSGLTEFNLYKESQRENKKMIPNLETKIDMRSKLNTILPPKLFESKGRYYIQNISTERPGPSHITFLQSSIDTMLLKRQARESGICPIREELHTQCFDEIIRHVSLELPERGLLLRRVRDELNMTIDAYKQLYEGAVSYGVKKQIQATKGMDELQVRIEKLEDRKNELAEKVSTTLTSETKVRDQKRRVEGKN